MSLGGNPGSAKLNTLSDQNVLFCWEGILFVLFNPWARLDASPGLPPMVVGVQLPTGPRI